MGNCKHQTCAKRGTAHVVNLATSEQEGADGNLWFLWSTSVKLGSDFYYPVSLNQQESGVMFTHVRVAQRPVSVLCTHEPKQLLRGPGHRVPDTHIDIHKLGVSTAQVRQCKVPPTLFAPTRR